MREQQYPKLHARERYCAMKCTTHIMPARLLVLLGKVLRQLLFIRTRHVSVKRESTGGRFELFCDLHQAPGDGYSFDGRFSDSRYVRLFVAAC